MRIHSIDYLRGIMALSVVLYHFSGLPDASSLLGRLGIYAVSSFYVISGMALFLAHKKDSWSVHNYCSFMLRRFARLAPVYWLALIIFTIYFFLFSDGPQISSWKYIQNILLIFGITNPTEYIIMGGWSIGNEVVFYLFFPLLIFFLLKKSGCG
ncbi:acyltransferase [Edwardsiella ictaluri]|uniref:acyltransferase family protein n=1 Tax=Edwardsiella ictaluri TaxID=67780 RepID=UPI0018C8C9EA|nr:acyltransferase family protein [Edwardsiella ictaluri]QPW27655.1 acyltransferase [Edwardsiella ictaluri]